MNQLLSILVLFLIIILCDLCFFYFIKDMFNQQIARVQGSPIVLNQKMFLSSLACYSFMTFGFYYFVVRLKFPIMDAFLMGLVINGIYEFTNYALLKDWNLMTVFVDTLWGGVLFSLVHLIYWRIQR